MTLKESMELGGECLLRWLDAKRDYTAYGTWITHDVGRWWDAMLRLENTTGFPIPAEIEGASLRNLHWLTDNPDGLLFVPPGLDWHLIRFELHSLREGILAFAALIEFRGNRWARDAGHKYLMTIDRCLNEDFAWDVDQFHYARQFTGCDNEHPTHYPARANDGQKIASHGRCIEALVWYYQTTGDDLAMELAERLARFHLHYVMNPDGTIPAELAADDSPSGDRQSYLYTLCGLLLFGVVTGQSEYVDAVVRAYSAGVPSIVNESGWVAHDLGRLNYPDKSGNPMANTESTGAAARLALWIAVHTGRAECYDDVQRLVRARLFPGQITERDLRDHPTVEVLPRYVGGWGANDYPHAGKGCNPSGTAEIVHTFCAIHQHVCRREKTGLVINMHFDYDDENVHMNTHRDEHATITIKPRVHDHLLIRIPAWVPAESLELAVGGKQVSPKMIGSYAYLEKDQIDAGTGVTLRHDLHARRSTETMPAGDTYSFSWLGDEIIGIDPNDKPLPFYPTL